MTSPSERSSALTWLRTTHHRFPTTGSGAGSQSARQIQFMNRVLCRIETFSTNIEAMPRSERNAAQAQLNELLGAGNFFNRGNADMDETLVEISTSGGSLSDPGSSDYTGGREKTFPHSVTASDTFVWFAAALDEKLSDARSRLLDYNSAFDDLAARVAVADPGGGTWGDVRTAFDAVTTARDRVERYHWLLAFPIQEIAGFARSQEFVTRVNAVIDNPALRHSLRGYDLISTLDTAARLTQDIQAAAGADRLPASSAETVRRFSHLLGLLRLTCHFLPVLGDFYESMFDGIPGLISNFRHALGSTDRRLAQSGVVFGDSPAAARGLHGTLPTVRPPAIQRSLCPKCGCQVQTPCLDT